MTAERSPVSEDTGREALDLLVALLIGDLREAALRLEARRPDVAKASDAVHAADRAGTPRDPADEDFRWQWTVDRHNLSAAITERLADALVAASTCDCKRSPWHYSRSDTHSLTAFGGYCCPRNTTNNVTATWDDLAAHLTDLTSKDLAR